MKKIICLLCFLFLVGGANALTVTFNGFTNNATTENQPRITGSANETTAVISAIECRVDDGAWSAATITAGVNTNTAAFSWTSVQALTRGIASHEMTVRCTAGGSTIVSADPYRFYVTGDRPEIGITSLGGAVLNGDTIAASPSFNITVLSINPPVTGVAILQKAGEAPANSAITLTVDPGNSYLYHGTYAPTLTDGQYNIKIQATDSTLPVARISTREATNLLVQSALDLTVQGVPLNYPNPFNPESGPTSISYTLSKAGEITLLVCDIMGNQISRQSYSSVVNGGRAGYNEVTWNGRDSGGNLAGNGIYIFVVIGDGKMLGKGKITVLK
jgi:hypothetical protein